MKKNRAERLEEGLKSVTEGVDQRAVEQMKANVKGADTPAHKTMVKAAAKAANSGETMGRLLGIIKAVGHPRLEKVISGLLDVRKELGHLPKWYSEAIDDVGESVAFALIFSHNFTQDDMEAVAWGLPLQALKDYGISRK